MPTTHPYLDPALSVAERVADLLSRLTLEEKAGQLTQYFYTGTGEPLPDDFDIESLPPEHRVHVELPARIEAAINAGRVGSLLFLRDPALSNRLQRRAVEESRLGIPLLFGFDVVHGWRGGFFRLDDHVERFLGSCAGLRLDPGLDAEGLRRVLADLAVHDKQGFAVIVEQAKAALA